MKGSTRSKAALLNADRLNFDGQLWFSQIESEVELVTYGVTDGEQLIERAEGCDILISKELAVPRGLIERLPSGVRLICEAGTGVDNIDLVAAMDRSISVCNVPGYSTSSVAQLTLAFVLALSTGMHRHMHPEVSRDGVAIQRWLSTEYSEVQGKTLGVIGAGTIGTRVIDLARSFAMEVLVLKRPGAIAADHNFSLRELPQLLDESDFITLHRPYNRGEPPLIEADTLARMRPHACLINTARGQLVNHDDLAKAIQSNVIAGAALDVQYPEPLPSDHPLWFLPNVILTPHIGWKAIESRVRLVKGVANNIRAFQEGAPTNLMLPTRRC